MDGPYLVKIEPGHVAWADPLVLHKAALVWNTTMNCTALYAAPYNSEHQHDAVNFIIVRPNMQKYDDLVSILLHLDFIRFLVNRSLGPFSLYVAMSVVLSVYYGPSPLSGGGGGGVKASNLSLGIT